MIFFDEHVVPLTELLAGLSARRPDVPVVIVNSAPSLLRATRLGSVHLDSGRLATLLGRERPRPTAARGPDGDLARRLLALTRGLPRLLRRLPGAPGDVSRYLQLMQYWIHGTPANLAGLLLTLAAHYGPPSARAALAGRTIPQPQIMPAAAIFHPDAPGVFADVAAYRAWRAGAGLAAGPAAAGTVGLLALRSAILPGNTAHVDALIRALDAAGLEPVPAYAGGLDMRAATRRFFAPSGSGASGAAQEGAAPLDVLLNLSGFALVGGMAQSEPALAEAELRRIDRPLVTGIPLNFQSLADWTASPTGITPVQVAMQLAVPELEGAVEPVVYGGLDAATGRTFAPEPANVARLADRVAGWARLARTPPARRRVAIVLFNFPPNGGAIGSAAYLAVFPSLYRILQELQDSGYAVDLPPDAETLRRMVVEGNALEFGTPANVAAALPAADYRRLAPWHAAISAGGWGPPPGNNQRRRRAHPDPRPRVRSRLRRRAAALRLRGRPDEAADEPGPDAAPRLCRLLRLAAWDLGRRRRLAPRHTRGAGVHAG